MNSKHNAVRNDSNWDVGCGCAFYDFWDYNTHVIKPFVIPKTFKVNRSFHWGYKRPFSVAWWAESDGSDIPLSGYGYDTLMRVPEGTLFRILDIYGKETHPIAVAEGIKAMEHSDSFLEMVGVDRDVLDGPADRNIFDTVNGGKSVAMDMYSRGIRWTRANQKPGSRVIGFRAIRDRLENSLVGKNSGPGLFIFDGCTGFIETIPMLWTDDRNTEDVADNEYVYAYQDTKARVLDSIDW